MMMNIESLWGPDTSYDGTFDESNPSRGQCAVTALLLHELYGYDIYDVKVGQTRHFFNKDGERVIDLTAAQFTVPIPYDAGRKRNPKDLYRNKDFISRYMRLKNKTERN